MEEIDRRRFCLNVDIGRTLEMIGIDAKFDPSTNQWKASCPNAKLGHSGDDRNPSWAIRDDIHHEAHGVHGCWSCGYSGHIISLVCDVLNLAGWKETIAWLQTHSMRGQSFAPLSVEIEVIAPHTDHPLQTPEGVKMLDNNAPYRFRRYWLDRRGFSMTDARRWLVGYADSGRVSERIWLPVRNTAGVLVNWTARAIEDDREPRYDRASSALEPDKGVIFGEVFWGGRRDICAVGEGELNMIRVDSVFDVPVAALGGGAKLNPIHAAKLMRFERLVVFADGDKTGDRLTSQLRDLNLPMAVIRFPKGYDPCSIPVANLREYGEKVALSPLASENGAD